MEAPRVMFDHLAGHTMAQTNQHTMNPYKGSVRIGIGSTVGMEKS